MWQESEFEKFEANDPKVAIKNKRITQAIRILSEEEFQVALAAVNLIASGKTRPLVYLACPYYHDDPLVREQRWRGANQAAAGLLLDGFKVFSPISHNHMLRGGLPPGALFDWLHYDKTFLYLSSMLLILPIDGWRESAGVAEEIKTAKEIDIPIHFVTDDGRIIEGHHGKETYGLGSEQPGARQTRIRAVPERSQHSGPK